MPFNVALIATLIKILAVVGYILLAVPMIVWLERKVIADFQARVGPSRVGPFGLLQSFADGIKLVMKESIVPRESDLLLYYLAPVAVLIPAISVAAVVPFAGELTVGGHTHSMVIADLPIGLLFVLALTSLGVYGVVLAGWSSNNKYSLLGGLRSSAQMVSYELPMGLSLVAGLMIASASDPIGIFSLSLTRVVETQSTGILSWGAVNLAFPFLGFLALVAYFICGVAETNRAPFDLAEAESELIGGYHTEYGGLKWAMFFLGEYAAMLNVAAVAVAVFLGGWHAPYPDTLFFAKGSIPYMLQGLTWFGIKVYTIILIYIHLRASLPRLRYDRLMTFSWKVMLPSTLGLVLVIAAILTIVHAESPPGALTANVNTAIPGLPPPAVQSPPGGNSPFGGGLPPGVDVRPGGNFPGSPGTRRPTRGSTPPATPPAESRR